MADTLICRVCGKEYDACHSKKTDHSTYRWFDVACCPEHGQEYLRQILESRGELKTTEKASATTATPATITKKVEDSRKENK